MKETLEGIVFKKPFPHLIINNFYNQEELDLIWEELNFYTKPGKLLEAKNFGGIPDKTNSHAILLDSLYGKCVGKDVVSFRSISNILKVNRKLFTSTATNIFSQIDDCCCIAAQSNWDVTKVRYYHDGEYYGEHTDRPMQFLAFSYFFKEPKRFSGGELFNTRYNIEFPCENNQMIIMPGWVSHGVRKVSIKDSDYYDGYGRYCISSFFGCRNKPWHK